MMLQLLKAAKSFSAVWQDGKTELAKDVLAEDVVAKDLLFGNVITGFDNWSKMVHGIFEVSSTTASADLLHKLLPGMTLHCRCISLALKLSRTQENRFVCFTP